MKNKENLPYYIVKAKYPTKSTSDGEIEFKSIQKTFHNEVPILARNEAFRYYQNLIEVFLESKGGKYYSDKQAREILIPFFNPEWDKNKSDANHMFSDFYSTGIGIFIKQPPQSDLVENELSKLLKLHKIDTELIHGIGNLNMIPVLSPILEDESSIFLCNLDEEFEIYSQNGFETQNQETEIVYFNRDEWDEGYLGNGQWLEEEGYHEPNSYIILKTPFDWKGYDKEYWWGEPEEDQENNTINIEQLIEGGENHNVEFKPSLLYNFKTKEAGIGVKNIIAKAICAFLNSDGGHLFIGITDKGEAQGLSYDYSLSKKEDKKDFFRVEFDNMIRHFLSFSVKDYVSGNFFEYHGKDVFVVTVKPNKNRPIFLKGQNGKEFYIRGEASSMPMTDLEEFYRYWFDKTKRGNT